MRVAVVDDEKSTLEEVHNILHEFTIQTNAKICAKFFQDSEALLMDISEGKTYDVYLLDIEMKSCDGINLAKRLRDKQSDVYIVFITNYARYAIEGYDVKAYQYILKTQLKNKLNATMETIYRDYVNKQEKYFVIETNSRYEKILYCEIYYICKEGKNAIFVTKFGKSQVRMTLQNVYKNLTHEDFIYIDRGYIVNIQYVRKFKGHEVYMMNGDVLPVSRPHMSEVKVRIGKYWRDKL